MTAGRVKYFIPFVTVQLSPATCERYHYYHTVFRNDSIPLLCFAGVPRLTDQPKMVYGPKLTNQPNIEDASFCG